MQILTYIDTNILNLGIGLVGLMIINIALGTGMAIIEDIRKFDWRKFLKGVLKSILVIISFVILYIVGDINADIITIDISGQVVNLKDGINIVLTLGAGFYAKKVFDKLLEILALKTESKQNI